MLKKKFSKKKGGVRNREGVDECGICHETLKVKDIPIRCKHCNDETAPICDKCFNIIKADNCPYCREKYEYTGKKLSEKIRERISREGSSWRETIQTGRQLAPRTSTAIPSAPRSMAPRTTAPRTTAPRSMAPRTTAPRTTAPRSMAPRTSTAIPSAPRTTAPTARDALDARAARAQRVAQARNNAPGRITNAARNNIRQADSLRTLTIQTSRL